MLRQLAFIAPLLVVGVPICVDGQSGGAHIVDSGTNVTTYVGRRVHVFVKVRAPGWILLRPKSDQVEEGCADLFKAHDDYLRYSVKGQETELVFELDGRFLPPGPYVISATPRNGADLPAQKFMRAYPDVNLRGDEFFVCARTPSSTPSPNVLRTSDGMATLEACGQGAAGGRVSCVPRGVGVVLNHRGLLLTTAAALGPTVNADGGLDEDVFAVMVSSRKRIGYTLAGSAFSERPIMKDTLVLMTPKKEQEGLPFATPASLKARQSVRPRAMTVLSALEDTSIAVTWRPSDAPDLSLLRRLGRVVLKRDCSRCAVAAPAGAPIVDGEGLVWALATGSVDSGAPSISARLLKGVEEWIADAKPNLRETP